ncbi:MAG: VCBS repeat-containing protein [Candidatus Midichloria mitochondrii]|nr:VCBS repeat-containing protein [Candidatus Midichloria mitochondrii]
MHLLLNYNLNGVSGRVVVSDFNRDGNSDIACTQPYAETVSILLGNSNGTFQPAISCGVSS